MLTYLEKRMIETVMASIISQNCNGINTRTLISQTLQSISTAIPLANAYHVSGMLAWLLQAYNFKLIIRKKGYSVIA